MENIQEIITNIATIITSGSVIVAFALKFGKRILDKTLEPFNEKMDRMDKLRVEQHKETINMIAEVKKDSDYKYIDEIKNRMVAFEMLCRMDPGYNTIKKYQYDNAFKDITKWKNYHKVYSDLNGEMDIVIENINEHFRHAQF